MIVMRKLVSDRLSKMLMPAFSSATAFAFSITFLAAFAGSLQAATTYTLADDAEVSSAGNVDSTASDYLYAGFSGSTSFSAVFVFALPDLAADEAFTSADFSANLNSIYSSPSYNGDLYGLDYRTSSSVLAGDAYSGTLDANATLVQDNYVTPTIGTGTKSTDATGDTNLLGYLNTQLAASATDRGLGNVAYVFIRVSADKTLSSNYTRYRFRPREYSTNSYYWGELQYETGVVPEPSTFALLAGFIALGSVMVRRRR